jgi:hypothetical protein
MIKTSMVLSKVNSMKKMLTHPILKIKKYNEYS